MKILVISDEFPPKLGGVGTIAKKLVENYCELGHQVTVISGDEAEELAVEYQHVKVKRPTVVWIWNYWRAIKKQLDLNSFDVIILNDVVSAYIGGLCFSASIFKKVRYIAHGSEGHYFFANQGVKSLLLQYNSVYSRLIKNTPKLLFVSRNCLERFVQSTPISLQSLVQSKSEVAFAGVDRRDFNKPAVEPALLSKNKCNLISVGRLIEGKGYAKMLSLFHCARLQNPSLHWTIIGSGPFQANIEAIIRDYDLSDAITLAGPIPREKLSSYYAQADVFWLLSPIESFGLVFLEANLFGTPSVSVEQLGAAEAIAEGINGVFYQEGDCLNDVFNKALQLNSDAIKSFAKKFDTLNFSQQLIRNIRG